MTNQLDMNVLNQILLEIYMQSINTLYISAYLYKYNEAHAQVYDITQEQAARVRVCNYVKFETGQNLLPVLKIVKPPAHAELT